MSASTLPSLSIVSPGEIDKQYIADLNRDRTIEITAVKQAAEVMKGARGQYTRELLIAICEAAVVSVDRWVNRDSPGAHTQLGLCWVLLKAGCEYTVFYRPEGKEGSGCFTDESTIWLEVRHPTFNTFEHGGGNEEYETFYLPTPARLERCGIRDWY